MRSAHPPEQRRFLMRCVRFVLVVCGVAPGPIMAPAVAFPPPDTGPGGPILVIASSVNPFSLYYAEILRAEGFNCFAVLDITQVTPAILATYDVAILGQFPLTLAQVAMFDAWLAEGGNLIAMRPDPQLAPLLGLTPLGSTLNSARPYLRIDPNSPPGAGISSQTLQFHADADAYALSGASAIATLYTSPNSATPYPAVTVRSIGSAGGSAAAFTFDLARSIVYTRQGNPAWAGQDRDHHPPIRTYDLFISGNNGDSQPDWIDLNKIAIPQADEQQRLLANLILTVNQNRKPLPRFWYFPRGYKAAVIMTGDQHGCCAPTQSRFQIYDNQSPPGCSVEDWECVRATSYLFYASNGMSDAEAWMWTNRGFEISVHVNTNCQNWTPASLDAAMTAHLVNFGLVWTIPRPTTQRTHCVAWSDYASQPQIEANHGIRLDLNYYYYPSFWAANRPGFFTGSGLCMRFATADGNMIDCYQAATQMTDESGQYYASTCDMLLDRALGPEGYYAALTANMHTDQASHAWSDAIVASAQARGVPVISARQMLTWLDAREASSFGAIAWNNGVLSFSVAAGPGARNLRGMLPVNFGPWVLSTLARDGVQATFTPDMIKGVVYAFFPADSGTYQAAYVMNSTPTGACCLATGACVVTVPADCAGSFHPEWPDCGSAVCPQRGACCFDDGHCTNILSQTCAAQNGIFRGENTACTQGYCPARGACCRPDGSCALVQLTTCQAQGGAFRGQNTSCGPGICPSPGACCLSDGSCVILSNTACIAQNGQYRGNNTPCQAGACPPVLSACCLSDTSCQEITSSGCAAQGGVWRFGFHCSGFQCPPANLLVNPGAETGDLSGWTVDLAGGSGWLAGFDSTVHSGQRSFATSSALCMRHQTVDLLASGYTPAQLDMSPMVLFAEWVGTRPDQGGQYFLRVELLDASQQVITFWEHGSVAAPVQVTPGTAFFQESHSFSNYGPGLRFLNVIDGGSDQGAWIGNYGVHFDDALAGIVPVGACCQPGGACQLTPYSACSRDWHGAWSACTPALCGGGAQGDMNCDGTFTPADAPAFALAMLDPESYATAYPGCPISNGDFNRDGRLDGADTQGFVAFLP